jgi:hypothetical protein
MPHTAALVFGRALPAASRARSPGLRILARVVFQFDIIFHGVVKLEAILSLLSVILCIW